MEAFFCVPIVSSRKVSRLMTRDTRDDVCVNTESDTYTTHIFEVITVSRERE